MRYTFEEFNRIYCISSTYENTSTGKEWSIKIDNPGQITPVWGGHFDRFFHISDEQSFETCLSSLPIGSPLNVHILRRGLKIYIQSNKIQSNHVNPKSLLSIGHPFGHNWIHRYGWLCNYSENELKVTQSLTEEGISGGPLIDDTLNLTGIILRKEDNLKYATAINIKAVLSFLTDLKLPSRIWLDEKTFCNNLRSALKYREKDFSANEIKIGAGKRSSSSIYY